MVACGHWVIASCLFMTSIILLGLFEKVTSRLGKENEGINVVDVSNNDSDGE